MATTSRPATKAAMVMILPSRLCSNLNRTTPQPLWKPGHDEDSSAGFVYVWEFTVDPKWQAEFERAYAPDGAWAQLFKKHFGYRGTQLLRHNADQLKYWTVDHWDSEASQRDFHLRFSAEFEDLDHRCEALTQKEELLGEFSLIVRASRASGQIDPISRQLTYNLHNQLPSF